MTAREKLAIEHPEKVYRGQTIEPGDDYSGGCQACPHTYGYIPYVDGQCIKMTCTECWDRDIPEEKENNMPTRKMTEDPIDRIDILKEELKKLEQYRKYDEDAETFKAIYDSFVRAGFTEDQAFTILITAMQK